MELYYWKIFFAFGKKIIRSYPYFCKMYGKAEASRLKQEFWIAFGQYMAPIPDAEGQKRNWINYKTGFKNLYFRMDADRFGASIGIEITHKDVEIQELFYEQFQALKGMLENSLNEEWNWEMHSTDTMGKTISRIYISKQGWNVFEKEHWPELIRFFKPRIIALDEFWSVAKMGFEDLR